MKKFNKFAKSASSKFKQGIKGVSKDGKVKTEKSLIFSSGGKASGYLVKEGLNVKSWKSRLFKLNGNVLSWSNATKCLGQIVLDDGAKVTECSGYKSRDNCFKIETRGRTLYLQASDAEEMKAWVKKLKSVCAMVKRKSAKVKSNEIKKARFEEEDEETDEAASVSNDSKISNDSRSESKSKRSSGSSKPTTAPVATSRVLRDSDGNYKLPPPKRTGEHLVDRQLKPSRHECEGESCLKAYQDEEEVISSFPEAWLEDWWEPEKIEKKIGELDRRYPLDFKIYLTLKNEGSESVKIKEVTTTRKTKAQMWIDDINLTLLTKRDEPEKWELECEEIEIPPSSEVKVIVRPIMFFFGKRPKDADDRTNLTPDTLAQPLLLKVHITDSEGKNVSIISEQCNSLTEEYLDRIPNVERIKKKWDLEDTDALVTFTDNLEKNERLWTATYFDSNKNCAIVKTPRTEIEINEQAIKDAIITSRIDKRTEVEYHKERFPKASMETNISGMPPDFEIKVCLLCDYEEEKAYGLKINISSPTSSVTEFTTIPKLKTALK